MKLLSMRQLAATISAGFLALAGFGAGRAEAGPPFNNFTFGMVPTNGAESCVPATGRVTVSPVDTTSALVENMHVEVSGLPPNTLFDLFVTQVPTSPFGLAWYLGDILTDGKGNGVQDFVGRFSIGTFIVALPPAAPAPRVLTAPPFPDAGSNLGKEGPVQLYHLGLWFDTPADANLAGCGNKVTPFNSTHNAGVQILNTSQFTRIGPLFFVKDR
jgi:hypothetical protein